VAGYIVDRHCFRGVIAVFQTAVVGYIVDHYCLRFDRGVVHIVVAGYNVDHYCLATPLSNIKQKWSTISPTTTV
jgi:hypothetical protein